MTGKRYYLATLSAWQRHAPRFANSHFVVLDVPVESAGPTPFAPPVVQSEAGNCTASSEPHHNLESGDSARIIVLVEADEGAHLALEDDPLFEPLPHPLANKPISDAAQSALASHGVAPGANTFDAAEALARVHPLLRHRVF
jgi:hypothetical protein